MTAGSCERLGAQDSSFLMFEGPTTPMHVGGLSIAETGPLATEGGGLDVERIRKAMDARLDSMPRYRQRVAFTPLAGRAIWVDDADFDIADHVLHTRLPAPGTERQLKDLAGRLMERPLDRSRPLWEMWFIEGVEGGRFAMLGKIHHSLIDGASGVNLMHTLYSDSPYEDVPAAPAWVPRPAPTRGELLREELAERARRPLDRARAAVGALRSPARTLESLERGARDVGRALRNGLALASPTPLNRRLGRHRRLDWCSLDLAAIKEVRRQLGCTVNDVMLTVVSGALHTFLEHRVPLDGLRFRVAVPVNTRASDDDFSAANRVGVFLLDLPVDEPEPLRRAERIRAQTERHKASGSAAGVDVLMDLVSGSPAALRLGVAAVNAMPTHNLVVTNVPGPQVPLYLLGARLVAMFPQLPLFERQGLGIALMSYCGRVYCGLLGDWDLVPDLADLASGIGVSFEELRGAARST